MPKTGFDEKRITVVDLFCGVGGLTHGFVQEKFTVAAGLDFDQSCQYAYEKNNNAKFIHADITTFKASQLKAFYPKGHTKILVGCAPCQPFSIYTTRNSTDSLKKRRADQKWKLLYSFSELIEKVKPEIISMENVPLLMKFNQGRVFKDFTGKLEKMGYHVSWSIVNAQDYGIPQRRKRLILFGSKYGKIQIINKTIKDKKYKTVREAIGDLPPVEDGISHPSDLLHRARKLTDLNKLRIQASSQGGNWREWDESLRLECHKKDNGSLFRSVYGRMKWDDVSPTMTTCCTGLSNGRFGHPEQDRAITLREAAILQSFPKSYSFVKDKANFTPAIIARHIGNAVPVQLGRVIAKSIKKHLKEIEKPRSSK